MEILDEAKVRDFNMVVNKEQILWFDIEMLKLILDIHQVERFGSLLHVAEEFFPRDTR